MFGENGEAEYGGDSAANDKPSWDQKDWDRVYTRSANVDRLIDVGVDLGAFDGKVRGSHFYRPVITTTADNSPDFHWWSYYEAWHPQRNYYHACDNTGFNCGPERSEGTYSKYSSLDDKLDGLHYYMAFLKFGIGRATSDAAHEVRDGDITREEALALVAKYDDEMPLKHFLDCMDYLGMDVDQFARVEDRFARIPVDRAA